MARKPHQKPHHKPRKLSPHQRRKPSRAVPSLRKRLVHTLRDVTGLTTEQLESLANTGLDVVSRERQHAEHDLILQAHLGDNRADFDRFDSVFQHTVKHPKYLSAGAFGITAVALFKNMAAPVVVKFAVSPEASKCQGHPGPSPPAKTASEALRSNLLCLVVDGWEHPNKELEWMGRYSTARERALNRAFSAIEAGGASPHFLHSYFSEAVRVHQPVTMEAIARWLGANPAQLKKHRRRRQTRSMQVAVSVFEFGGIPMKTIIRDVIFHRTGDALAIACFRAAIVQIMHGLVVAVNEFDIRHNDFHLGNVLGTVTNAHYLNYSVQLEVNASAAKGASGTMTFKVVRVPTYGILWRIIDFGSGSSVAQFGPMDHALTARAFTGGMLWRHAVQHPRMQAMPAELFDLARFLDQLGFELPYAYSQVVATTLRRDLIALADIAVALGKRVRGTMSIRDFQHLPTLRVTDVREGTTRRAETVREVADAHTACRDKGLMLQMFLYATKRFGFDVTDDPSQQQDLQESDRFSNVFAIHAQYPKPKPAPA